MFDNMPDVSSKKKKTAPAQSNKQLPLVLAGVGCLVLMLCLVLAGGAGWFFTMGPGANTANSVMPAPNQPSSSAAPANANTGKTNYKIAYSVQIGDSPEGKSVWIINSDGSGAKQLLTQASSPTFSPDGKLIAYYHWTDGIYLANADGTNPRKIVGETNAKFLAWSPDGKWIAFSSNPSGKENVNWNIDAVQIDGSQRRTIIIGGSTPSWSNDASRIAFGSCRGADCGLLVANSLGGDAGKLIAGEFGAAPAWSPDGTKIVYQAETDQVKHLFIINPDGTGKKQLTSGTAHQVGAQWSPDGTTIFYRSSEGGNWGIWKMNANGTNPIKLVGDATPPDWAFERVAVGR